MAHVAGFTVAHDVSARDWQMKRNGKQWLLGKTFDTFCPLGPALVTKDGVAGRSLRAHGRLSLLLHGYVKVQKKQCSGSGSVGCSLMRIPPPPAAFC